MLRISFQNSGGELDSRIVSNPIEALAALKDILDGIDMLFAGDRVVVVDISPAKRLIDCTTILAPRGFQGHGDMT